MSINDARSQSGQAMVEFVIAMLVVLPLVLGVIYIGKYQDVKYSAVQASRYAAFERVYDPSSIHKDPTVLAGETRQRFFTDPMLNNSGAVGFRDAPQRTQTAGTLNQDWYGTAGDPIVSNYSNITASVNKLENPPGTLTNGFLDLVGSFNFNINDPGIVQAEVQVPLVSIPNIGPLNNVNLKIDAKTAVLTDGYNASGGVRSSGDPLASYTVHDRVAYDWGIFLNKFGLSSLFQGLKAATEPVYQLLSDTPGPQWGCVVPDVVPTDATDAGTGVQYTPPAHC